MYLLFLNLDLSKQAKKNKKKRAKTISYHQLTINKINN